MLLLIVLKIAPVSPFPPEKKAAPSFLLQQMLQETKYTAVMQLWQKSYSGWSVLTKHMPTSYFTGSTFKLNVA